MVVVLPSPAGVGEMAVTSTSLPSGRPRGSAGTRGRSWPCSGRRARAAPRGCRAARGDVRDAPHLGALRDFDVAQEAPLCRPITMPGRLSAAPQPAGPVPDETEFTRRRPEGPQPARSFAYGRRGIDDSHTDRPGAAAADFRGGGPVERHSCTDAPDDMTSNRATPPADEPWRPRWRAPKPRSRGRPL